MILQGPCCGKNDDLATLDHSFFFSFLFFSFFFFSPVCLFDDGGGEERHATQKSKEELHRDPPFAKQRATRLAGKATK